ncbi:P-loop containing nucleoside triphosphate hydrolase protein [Earliella scabrosa]|nr:P-loop containing nucleoside triphosphate hydrolase protein [Earliella scabrosa]
MTSQGPTIMNTDYGKTSKELIEFVGQLRALGAHIDVELPRIVVIGNQSAGKSSLVEAISGISVPRDAGTCTRCPMECRLAHSSGEWSCQIKIRWEYDEGKDQRLEEVEEIEFGPLLTDKQEVEPMLRRAQAAVLRPGVDSSKFVNMTDADLQSKDKKSLRFSRNVVCVELTGPDLADLSFVDLPGIVQNADAEIVNLIEDLVNSYIKGNSLILVTMPMSDDIENQKAARLAQLADPAGSRTIGVMTKPDTLAAGSTKARDLWLEVLEGRRHPLRHGYFCTRQPDDDERLRGISPADARAAELAFFQNTVPWASSSHRHRFGTNNLVQNISKLLTQIIRESLPALLDQIAAQLETCNEQLRPLPPPITTEPTAFVVDLVTAFCNDLAQRIRGSPTHTQLVQNTRRTYESFKFTIRSSAPPFVPYQDEKHAPQDISQYVRVDANDRSARGKKYNGTVMYLEDVRRHISTSITRELPGNVPYAAKLALLQAFQQSWEKSMLQCFNEVQEMFKVAVAELIRLYFDRYSNLKAIVGPATNELVKSCTEKTVSQLRTVLQLETSPYTQNLHYLTTTRDGWLAKYKDARAGNRPAERVTPASAPIPASQPFSFRAPGTPAATEKAPAKPTGAPVPRKDAPAKAVRGQPSKPAATTSPFGGLAPAAKAASSQDEDESSDSSDEGESSEEEDSVPVKSAPASGSVAFAFGTPASTSRAPPQQQHESSEDKEKKAKLIKKTLANLVELGYEGISAEDLGKLNPPDEYEDELQVMAEVRAYFQVAYKRVIDYIPLSIDHHFLYAFADALPHELFTRLGLGAANAAARCDSYIAEDPTIVATRDELLAKKKRLENVQRALYDFGL